MLVTITLTLLTSLHSQSSWKAVEFSDPAIRQSYGFSSLESSGTRRFTASRPTDQAVLTIQLRDDDRIPASVEELSAFQYSVKPQINWSPSGLWMGRFWVWGRPDDNASQFTTSFGFRESVTVSIGRMPNRQDMHDFPKIDALAERARVETFARDTLGAFAGRRLQEDGSMTVAGHSYATFSASGTTTRYIDLAAWAEQNNLVVGSGQDGTVKSFTKGGQLWIIPLASVKIKKGSTWQSLPDLVMRKDGKFYIPVAALQ